MPMPNWLSRFFTTCTLMALSASTAAAASPTAAQALRLTPIQKQVDYDRPDGEQAEKCTIKPEKLEGHTGWVVRNGNGQILRRFVDTNGDKVVDQWCYFSHGIETYRDVDADFNGKADQYRWLNTSGIRWGQDSNEDGRIDQWKAISAEEVSAEVVAALVDRDERRFGRLLITPSELKSLGLGPQMRDTITDKLSTAASRFKQLAGSQKQMTSKTEWLQFAATKPGVVPKGTDGSTADCQVYENVMAIVRTGEDHGQVQVGTLVRVGSTWRVIDAPQLLAEGTAQTSSGLFFAVSTAARPEGGGPDTAATGGISSEMQDLLAEMEKLDQQGAGKTVAEQSRHHAKRTDLLEKLAAAAATRADKEQWLRQLADLVSAAVQTGQYPEGLARLKTLSENQLRSKNRDLAAYVKFRYLTADNVVSLQSPKADYAKLQEAWLKSLQDFVKEFPTSDDAAEAMLQLGIAQEFGGNEAEAKGWYGKIIKQFPQAAAANKARGATLRLTSVGKTIRLAGSDAAGRKVDLERYRGRVVLIHYWATWCEPCKADLARIGELLKKHSKTFAAIGVSLDAQKSDLTSYLATNRLSWPQLYEPGGLDGRLANELGILTLPTMILVDQRGRVVNRNVHITELESELKKLSR